MVPLHIQFPPLFGYHPVLAGVLIAVIVVGTVVSHLRRN